MGYALDDLGRLTDEALVARGMGAEAMLALSALRDVRGARDVYALVRRWGKLLRAASATTTGRRAIPALVRYIADVHHGLEVETLAQLAEDQIAGTGAEIMTTVRQLKAEGRAEGRAEARLATFERLLRLKFGLAANEEVLARVRGADAATLDALTDRILTATTVDELFA
jgi:hypothetical protein